MNDISLYLHIPFCAAKCDYCAFFSVCGVSDSVKDDYAKALMRQISFFETEKRVTSVYIGGGTPPVIGTERLCRIIRTTAEKFGLTDETEITVEVNPKTVDEKALCFLRQSGANRLSVGIQSADDSVLRSLGRIHCFSDAENCFSAARKAGFENISADIMFALPYSGKISFSDNIKKILSLAPDHISAYSLQLEEGTKLFKKADALHFPDEDEEEEQYGELCRIIKESGFEHYEISSFARNGKYSRHNMGYWTMREYMGFGAGAHSFIGNKRFYAEPDIQKFISKSFISAYAPTNYDAAAIESISEIEEERIMLMLRTSSGASLYGKMLLKAEAIAEAGFGTVNGDIFSLNEKGFRVSNKIIAEILTAEN